MSKQGLFALLVYSWQSPIPCLQQPPVSNLHPAPAATYTVFTPYPTLSLDFNLGI